MATGDILTPEYAHDRTTGTARQKAALALLMQGTSGEPVRAWTQGAARVAQGLLGGYELGDEERKAAANELKVQHALANLPGLASNEGAMPQRADASAAATGSYEPQAAAKPIVADPYNKTVAALTGVDGTVNPQELPVTQMETGKPPDRWMTRGAFAPELADPYVRNRLTRLASAEVGGQGQKATDAFVPTVLDRASARGQTATQAANDAGYYPGISLRGKTPSSVDQVVIDDAIAKAQRGMDITGGATGNASGTVGFAGGPQTAAYGGERFGIEGPDRQWAATGVPTPRPATPSPYPQVAQAGQPSPAPRQGPAIDPRESAYIRGLLANPETRAIGLQLYQQRQKPVETYRPATPQERAAYGVSAEHPLAIDTVTNKPQFGPPQTNVSLSTEKKGQEHLAVKAIDAYTTSQQTAVEAQRRVALYDRLEQAAKAFTPGATAETRLTAMRYLKDLGLIKGENVGEGEVAKMISTQLGIHAQPAGQGSVSNYERQLYSAARPGILQSPQGLRMAISIQRDLEKRDIQVADIWSESADKNGGIPNYSEVQKKIRALGSPLSDAQRQAIADNTPEAGAPAPVDLKKKYNLE